MGAIVDKIKGKAKQVEGRLTGDRVRVAQGKAEAAKGNIEGALDRGARKVKAAAHRMSARATTRTRATSARVHRRARAR